MTFRPTRLLVLATAVLTLAAATLVSPMAATAAAKTTVTISGSRVVVTIKGKKVKKPVLLVAGTRYPLKRSGKKWRSKPLPADLIAAMSGQTVKVKARVGKKKRTFNATVPGGPTGPVNPAPGTPASPLFTAPGVDRAGNEAYDAIKGYFADSTLTDCPAGWPNCSVEQRYGFFADGTQWYCRLTPTSGSDIRSVGQIQEIIGAEQKADGAWGVSYRMNSYGDTVYYSVRVAASGSGTVQYWGPGVSTGGPPSDAYTGLQWQRGAKDCSY